MFLLYQIFQTIILIFSPIILIYRLFKKKEDSKRFYEKFGIPTKNKYKKNLIWFHGASVGELLSITPLLNHYDKNKKIDQILVTSSTVSSSKVFQKFKYNKVIHQFYPLDHFFITSKFLKFWKPKIVFFIDSEIWPNIYRNLAEKKIPIILLNARLTKKSFKRWMKIHVFAKSIFSKIKIAFPQNKETKLFLKKINSTKIKFIGNLKFIKNKQENFYEYNKNLKLKLKNRKIWVASSTHDGEELFCAKAHIEIKRKIKKLITIIIPRHIHRVDKIKSEIENLNLKVSLHSSKFKDLKKTDIYLVDTFGETNYFHKLSSSVFLGGSIKQRGGQNPLEAARYGSKILHGPNIDNFKDIYSMLNFLKISKKVQSPKQLASSISFIKEKNLGKKIEKIGTKILKKTINELDKHIYNEIKKT